MNIIKKIYKNEKVQTVALGAFVVVMMFGYAIMFLHAAFPKDPEMEAKMPIIEENAEKRAEAIKQLQKEAMCEDERFTMADCEDCE